MERAQRFSLVLSFLLVASAAADVQHGIVRSGGRPVPGAAVNADCGAEKISTVTDADGRYEMGGLPAAPCKFSVGIFGFDAQPKEAKASAASLDFDLQLQSHASLPTAPAAPAAQSTPTQAGTQTPPAGPGRGGFGGGRGGFGAGRGGYGAGRGGYGRGGGGGQQTAQGAAPAGGRGGANAPQPNNNFQNLNLVQNGEAPVESDNAAPGGFGGNVDAAGANDALAITGSLSQAVQTQPGDGVGMGGAFGFGQGGPGGFGPGGPGGLGLNVFGPGGDNGQAGDPNGGLVAGGGRGGPGGPGGGGFAGGGLGGGRGGGGFGGRGGGRGPGRAGANGRAQFGNRVNRGRGQQWRLSANYSLANSALNARPYSFTAPQFINGEPVPKAAYANNRFGFSVGGPFAIPKLFHSDKTFWFVNYTGQRTRNGFDRITTVPLATQRLGDFSGTAQTIFDPATNAPFAGNIIPTSRISPVANALLGYIPLPNASGLRNNYQLIGANPSNANNIQVMVNQTVTTKDRLALNFNHQSRNSENVQTFGFLDPATGSGLSSNLTYSHTFRRGLINNLVFQFSRNVNNNYSFFSNGANVAGELGITGVSNDPLAYGPPTVSFTNFGSLTDGLPSLTRQQTAGLNESMIWLKGKHNVNFGGGFQRRQNNTLTYQGARGSFNFTGIQTQAVGADGLPITGTGYDLADFLLNRPYSTAVNQYLDGNNSFYFRETAANAYISDDWRWKSNFSIISGLRWEYFGPYTEKNNRLATLDVAPGYAGVAVVTPGQTGPLTQQQYGAGLIQGRPLLFSPREGIAWKPWKSRQLVVRAGYGLYYTGSVYGAFASRLSLQPPFVNAISTTATGGNLSFENGFITLPGQTITNTFAVAQDYKPAYAQSWNLSLQQTFWRNYVIQVGYQGTKGTHLDVLQSPNRAPLGGSSLTTQQRLQIPYATTFTYDLSAGNSIYNAGQVSFIRRMARNRSFNLTYVWSKALDDTSTLGGGVVQIVNDIRAERGLSNNDIRHRLTLNYQIQSPVGPDRTSWRWHAIRGWTLNGSLTANSGSSFNATVAGDPSGTGIIGGARAQATGLPVEIGSGYFNPAAFAVPATGTYGNVGRNTIPGIPNFSLNANLFRNFRIRERHTLSFTISSSNPLNHVNVNAIGTVIGSINQGLPVGAAAMRTITAQTRFNW